MTDLHFVRISYLHLNVHDSISIKYNIFFYLTLLKLNSIFFGYQHHNHSRMNPKKLFFFSFIKDIFATILPLDIFVISMVIDRFVIVNIYKLISLIIEGMCVSIFKGGNNCHHSYWSYFCYFINIFICSALLFLSCFPNFLLL